MSKHHPLIFSINAKNLFKENGHHHTKEVAFFEWFETPLNYKTPADHRRKQKKEEAKKEAYLHLEPTGKVSQIIMFGILGACVIGLYTLVLI